MKEKLQAGSYWSGRTMSMLKDHRLEECEKRIDELPCIDLFEADCTDIHAERLWEASYDAAGKAAPMLHTVEGLRRMVLERLPQEAEMLSEQESLLLQRVAMGGGETELRDPEEGRAAESLVRRFWCHVEWDAQDKLFLCMTEPFLRTLINKTDPKKLFEKRFMLFQMETVIRAMLYLRGCVPMADCLSHLAEEIFPGGCDAQLAERYFLASFDHYTARDGQVWLCHPGLAEPQRFVGGLFDEEAVLSLPEEDMIGAAAGMLPSEKPSADAMLGLICKCARPEYTPEEVVDDLRILCKQGVPLAELRTVLADLITCLPTESMEMGLKKLIMETMPWSGTAEALN